MKTYFEGIVDSRQQGKIKYNLVETIIITIIAVTAGAKHWNEIAMYCKAKEKMLRKKFGLKLENGIPTDDTFRRIFAIIKPNELEKCFIKWVNSVNDVTENEIINVDGKTLRGSQTRNYSAIHMISAFASKAGIVLGQLRVNEKSNEIPAVPQLLDLIDVRGCTITSDAMSCQKKTVQKIVDNKCEYVICLKGNQGKLHEDVKLYFETALREKELFPLMNKNTFDKGHGRIEKRKYYLTKDIEWIENRSEWVGLNAIGMVQSTRIIDDVETTENRFFISSVTDIYHFADAARKHWNIENNLHWCLDEIFDEDKCRMRVDNSGENLAVIRHIALNLFKSFQSKLSMKAKRFRCSFDENFLTSVILNKFF